MPTHLSSDKSPTVDNLIFNNTDAFEEAESDSESIEESSVENENNSKQEEVQQEEAEKSDEKPTKVAKSENKKEKAVKKIMKKISDKQKYDSANQMKTLIVMQVLSNSKSFFESQTTLNDRIGFFSDATLPDTIINDNNIAGYYLFAGSDGLMNEMIMQQWQTGSE